MLGGQTPSNAIRTGPAVGSVFAEELEMSKKQVFFGSIGMNFVGSGCTQIGIVGGGSMVVGSGKSVVQARTVQGDFNLLEVTGSAEIEVRRADCCTVEVQGEDNLVDFLETKLIGSTLHVGIKRGVSFTSHLPLKVVATAPSITDVDLSGSGDVMLAGLEQAELLVELNGSGDVVADGTVASVSLTLHGSGDIDTRRLNARKANIKLHGSGDIRAFAKEEAKVRLHGSGDVVVKVCPTIRDARVSGSGDIDFDE